RRVQSPSRFAFPGLDHRWRDAVVNVVLHVPLHGSKDELVVSSRGDQIVRGDQATAASTPSRACWSSGAWPSTVLTFIEHSHPPNSSNRIDRLISNRPNALL